MGMPAPVKSAAEQKEEFEMLIHKTLQGNVLIIGKMRENLLTGKLMDNYSLMEKFDENINIIISMLDTLQCRMPALPVQVNKLLLSAHQSQKGEGVVGQLPPVTSGDMEVSFNSLLAQQQAGMPWAPGSLSGPGGGGGFFGSK
mmetsp:Transcript_17849/g.28907  ORF Transcript_17849/g.28907 Transcript_17849/m.28907 type:complete len:143 (+) Transcript_17849:2-430(+)